MQELANAYELFIVVLMALFLFGGPVFLTVCNVVFAFRKHPPKKFSLVVDLLIMIFGPLLMLLLFWSWGTTVDWQDSLHLGGGEMPFHTPIASWHAPSVLLLAVVAIAGYLVLRIGRTKLPPLLITICMAATYLGCALGVMFVVQLGQNLWEAAALFPVVEGILMCLFPLNYLLCTVVLIIRIVREGKDKLVGEPRHAWAKWCGKMLQKSGRWPLAALFVMWPLLGIFIAVMAVFGQQPDALIRAFTETSDWTLSTKVSPPPVYYDAHYLCTVAAGGHEKLVRRERMGVRHGHKIPVNRQLLVANAFEELVQERAPRLHRLIRGIYDRSGFSLSKHIKTPVAADICYLFMKPLEWVFAAVLYVCDRHPENRIARQYLPPKVQKQLREALDEKGN